MQLPEQLAEIDHIFCDKTGTLTQNELLFGAVSINGQVCEGKSTEEILEKVKQTTDSEAVENLFKCFCLCNDASFVRDQITKVNKVQGSSQDELLLLEVADKSGIYSLIDRNQKRFILKQGQETHEYTLLKHI